MIRPPKLMQPGVPSIIKQGVIEDWCRGLKRDDIADKHGIGTGTVTRIIREWVAAFEVGDVADAMRYFAVTFRKLKLTIPHCVLGARNVGVMINLGIEENDFEEFISDTYKFLKELGADPKRMAYCVKQMQDLTGTITIAQIPQYISELDAQKTQTLENIDELKTTELDMKARVDMLKKEAKDLGEQLQQFAGIKSELKKYGLEIDNIESFGQTVKVAHELGYDAHLIGSKLRYWNDLEKTHTDLAASVLELEQKKDLLEQRISHLEAKQRYYSSHGYRL